MGILQKREYHGSKFDIVNKLKQEIVLEWRALPHGASLITASLNGDAVCSVLWVRIAEHRTQSLLSVAFDALASTFLRTTFFVQKIYY